MLIYVVYCSGKERLRLVFQIGLKLDQNLVKQKKRKRC